MKDIVRESIHENAPPSKSHWFLLTLLCIFYKRQHVFCALPDIWKAAYWGAPMLIAWVNIYGCARKIVFVRYRTDPFQAFEHSVPV
jgi:hypothetical protein